MQLKSRASQTRRPSPGRWKALLPGVFPPGGGAALAGNASRCPQSPLQPPGKGQPHRTATLRQERLRKPAAEWDPWLPRRAAPGTAPTQPLSDAVPLQQQVTRQEPEPGPTISHPGQGSRRLTSPRRQQRKPPAAGPRTRRLMQRRPSSAPVLT